MTSFIRQAQLVVFFIVCILFSVVKSEWALDPSRSSPCASLFTNGDDNTGTKYDLADAITLSDTSAISAWNKTTSLQIHSGCTLTLCHIPLLNETKASTQLCHNFVKNTNHLPEEWYSESSIAHCHCAKKCNCVDISLRRKECARAYLENDCNACNSFYTNLKKGTRKGQVEVLPSRLQNVVRAVIVRPGCKLEIMNGSTVQTSISGEIVQKWEGDLAQYQCMCDDSSSSQRFATTKPFGTFANDSTTLIDVPKTSGGINFALNSQWKNHPGLIAALQSLTNKRSSRNAYILMLGETGSGKSTTINFLFDNSNITKVGDEHSTTTNIHEYRISVPLPELGLNNTELRIIDTPGIIDTRGLEQDARYLATLDEYLKKHEDLKRSIPNVVLIFLKFNDNRFSGYGSHFVKMLRTIDLFRDRIFDKKFSNVIFVATHYMSESKDIVQRPHQRLAQLKKVIQEFTLFPAPIIISLAENKPEASNLLSVNGFYALPNGEFYPKNLFDRIQLVTTTGGDPIGEAVIRTAFKTSDFSHDGEGTDDRIKEIVFPLVASTHSRVIEYLGTLSSLNTNPSKTQVSQALEKAYDSLAADVKLNFDQLGTIQRTFYLNRISTFDEVPRTREEMFKLLKQLPRSPIVSQILQIALNLSIPVYEPSTLIGYGYSLVEDVSLPTSPLQLPEGVSLAEVNDTDSSASMMILTDTGFMMPKLYKCELRTAVNTVFQNFVSKEEYVKFRLGSILGAETQIPNALITTGSQAVKMSTKPGLNFIDLEDESTPRARTLSAMIEYQTFSLTLNHELMQLNDEFTNTIQGLPVFNRSSWNTVNSWKDFFTKYGTHVVDSCYAGGYIEIIVKKPTTVTQNETDADLLESHRMLTEGASKIVDYIAGLMTGKEASFGIANGIEYDIHYRGGNHKHRVRNLSDPDARTKLHSWKESLAYNPIILARNSQFTLQPISDLVQKLIGENEATNVLNAASALFNGSLSYKPGPSRRGHYAPQDRSQTQGVSATGDFQVLKEFAQLLKDMADNARERNDKLLTTMLENKQESDRLAAVEDENRRTSFANTLNANRAELDEMRRHILESDKIRSEREERDDQTRHDRFDQFTSQVFQSMDASTKRHQEFTMFIIESNRVAEEARRKNSIWNKITDSVLPIITSAGTSIVTAFG